MKGFASMVGAMFLGCAEPKGSVEPPPYAPPLQPIELSSEPGSLGVAVGVQTVEFDGHTLEVWYPAADQGQGDLETEMGFGEFIPDSFRSAVEGFELPRIVAPVEEGAPVRDAGTPLPVLLFSHGFGGMRIQSFGLTSHLASRGYVVVAPDHPGRMLTDVLPCIFSPPLEGCDLSGFGADPGPEGLAAALAWVDEASSSGVFEGRIDEGTVGIIGHSAGAGSVTAFADIEPRVSAVAPMAGGSVPDREVPTLRMDGSCDGFVPAAEPSTVDGRLDATFVTVVGAGHLAFSDLCELDINGFADEFLEGRDDLNALLYPQLRGLGTDGCGGAEPQVEDEGCDPDFLALADSDAIVRHSATVFFDRVLKGIEHEERRFDAASIYRP
jgi:predicted dienelactone hydrolase